jgi:hypothetical protein
LLLLVAVVVNQVTVVVAVREVIEILICPKPLVAVARVKLH